MKDNSNSVIAIILVVVFSAAILIWLNYEPKYQWHETLRIRSEQPYDLTVFKSVLDSATVGEMIVAKNPTDESLKDRTNCNYFYFGNYLHLDSTQADALFQFVESGNDAFIATNVFPTHFYLELDKREIWMNQTEWTLSENVYSSVANVRSRNGENHKFSFRGYNNENENWWGFFNSDPDQPVDTLETDSILYDFEQVQNDSISEGTYTVEVSDEVDFSIDSLIEAQDYTPLRIVPTDTCGWEYPKPIGYYHTQLNNDTAFINFVKLKIGEGTLYLHANPVLFSNYFLLKEDGFTYTNEAMAQLSADTAIWDAYHQINHTEYEMPQQSRSSPLRFIFENPPLKYSWYTLVFAAILFLVFRGKRQQNIIPIIPKVENTSIEFAKSLGALYFQAPSGRYLAIEQMKLFNNFNRRNYGVQRKKNSEGLADQISKKSHVKSALIQKILDLELKIVYNPNSDLKEVAILYQYLEEYYKQTKK